MSDYKEILRNKATQLRTMLAKYKDKINDEERNNIQILLDNVIEITNGRLDSLDYDVRNEGIMNYHNELDNAMRTLSRFEDKERNDNEQENT